MSALPPYATTPQRVWYYSFRVICGLIFFFLIAPIAVIIPLSFNAQDFFTFTPEMLRLDPAGFSLKHYDDFFNNEAWQSSMWNSLKIAPMATIVSVTFGTLAAIGLSQPHVPFRRAIMAILISPMIVPLIISAAGMYFFYSRIGLQGTIIGEMRIAMIARRNGTCGWLRPMAARVPKVTETMVAIGAIFSEFHIEVCQESSPKKFR
jgi:putative spermidine/putrescine transport system permease protein